MPLSSKRLLQGDPVIWVVFFLLCMISLVEVFSAASALSYKTGDYMAPFFKQLRYLAIGSLVAWGIHNIPCRFFKLVPIILYPLSVLALVLVFFIGASVNGSNRWLFGFQPSEVAKGVTIITVALILSYGQTENGADSKSMKKILWLAGLVCVLIFPENLSTAVLLFATVLVMMFVGRIPIKQMTRLLLALVAIGIAGALFIAVMPRSTLDSVGLHRATMWKDRVLTQAEGEGGFVVKDSHGRDSLDDHRLLEYLQEHPQEAHANIAIASCNGYGKMPGNSDQRDHLAQAYSDFIYAIIIEETGVEGAFVVVFLYIVLLFRAGRIASRCERNFPAFLTMGLATLLVMQAMMNVLVAVGIAPVTGQPLPLISRGGSSTLINCAYFGIILSVSRYARKAPDEKSPRQLPSPSRAEANAEEEDPMQKEFESNEGMA